MREDLPTVPPPAGATPGYGSDAVAEMLRRLELPFVSLTPGSSFRGLHDSLVNYLGGRRPRLVLCLHEEHAVAVAHGYAKVTGRPMAVALHSNVGLMHASMALYNAWCDRMPMLVLGGTGPLDAAARRPWIDWIHTAVDQAQLVRPFTKWDDQPASAQAAVDAVLQAYTITTSRPTAPVYLCLDAGLQERALDGVPVRFPAPDRYAGPDPGTVEPAQAARIAAVLAAARHPVLLVGRVERDQASWDRRVELAERLGAAVLTDLKLPAAFPTDHPAHAVPPAVFLPPAGQRLLRAADVVVSLDWVDLGGTLQQAYPDGPAQLTIVSCTADQALHNGWSKDHFRLPPADLSTTAPADRLVRTLLELLPAGAPSDPARSTPEPADPGLDRRAPAGPATGRPITIRDLADVLRRALTGRPYCLARLPLGWDASSWPFHGPLDYLGHEGGAGVGSGPGLAVGAALALDGTGRLPVAVLGDGDFLMGASALWTAAHHGLPLLVVVANNRSFFNDEVHQQRVAVARSRPAANRWVGQALRNPAPDLAAAARALGLAGYGPVRDLAELADVLAGAVRQAAGGASVAVDVLVTSDGYPGLAEVEAAAANQTARR